MPTIAHLDEAAVEIMINLTLHLGFDLLQNIIRIRHGQIFGVDINLCKVPLVVSVNCLEAVPFTGKVIPVGFRRVLESGGKWVVGRVDGPSVRGARRNGDEGEGDLVVLAKANRGNGLGFRVPEKPEILLHSGPIPSAVGDMIELRFFDLTDQAGGIWKVVLGRWGAKPEPVIDWKAHLSDACEQVEPRQEEPKSRSQTSCYDTPECQPECQKRGNQKGESAKLSKNQSPAGAQGDADDNTGEDNEKVMHLIYVLGRTR